MIDPKIMEWDKCAREFIRKVEEDPQRIASIIVKAQQRLQRAQNTPISEETVSFVVEDYYEVIKELLVAYLLKQGLRSKNHQCLISYFYKTSPQYEKEAITIAQMSFFRNRLDYYGESIPLDFYQKNKDEFMKIIKIIEELLS